MINFINILLANSKLKQAKLYTAAKKAFENPSIGVTINNPAAAHVIKDCAEIALKYLPLFVFASYDSPFKELSAKFSKDDINEFVGLCGQDASLNQLLVLILDKVRKQFPTIFDTRTVVEQTQTISVTEDPYMDYYAERAVEVKQKSIEEILQEAFKCAG